ncbi:hypothetical protein JKF63_03357 [Porcisia hertigi]|uniref:Protein kinase domain-containing protein n=1 Tax=Porcisia hertigi TaxID=2761500 RepID=A0A836IIL9_9TRYP|nr:hypothetical protein JKF63_03357 [Porcisia hertigi]
MSSQGEHIRLDKGSVVRGHYEVVAPIGSGNFSRVYRVVDLKLPAKEQRRRPLAMKVIKREYSNDAKYEKQMLMVLHNHDKLHSARVSKMYECFVSQDCPVFIMPMHGPSLRSRRFGLNRGFVTREKLLQLSYDLLETLEFVHFHCNMVHTDLKPENILIADSNVAEDSIGNEWVVCDFGSASLWRMDKLDSDLISTRPYRAPEVILGNKWHYAADMWSLGCILYEVAAGYRLFEIRDDLTHLHMMNCRIGRMPELFAKHSKYSNRYFNSRGEFFSTPDTIRLSKPRLTPIRKMFKNDRGFLQLLRGLLTYSPEERMTATQALALPVFDTIRADRAGRQQQAVADAVAHRQDDHDAEIAVLGGGTSPRLTDRSDSNTLEQLAVDGRKQGSVSSAHHDSGGAAPQASSGRASNTLVIANPTVDGAAATAGAKDHSSSRGHHHHHTPGKVGGKHTLGSCSETCTKTSPTTAPLAAAGVPGIRPRSSQLGGCQAAAGTSKDAAGTTLTNATAMAHLMVEEPSFSPTPSVSAGLTASPSRTQASKKSTLSRKKANAPLLRGGGSPHTGSTSSMTEVATKDVLRSSSAVKRLGLSSTGSPTYAPQIPPPHLDGCLRVSENLTTTPPSKSGPRGSGGLARKYSGHTPSRASSNCTTTPHKGTSSGLRQGSGNMVAGGGDAQPRRQSQPKSPRKRLHHHAGINLHKTHSAALPGTSNIPNRSVEARFPTNAQSPIKTAKASSASGPAPKSGISVPVVSSPPSLRAFCAVAPRCSSATRDSPQHPATELGSKARPATPKEIAAGVSTPLRLAPPALFSKLLSPRTAAAEAKTPYRGLLSCETRVVHRSPIQRSTTAVDKRMRAGSLLAQDAPGVYDRRLDGEDAAAEASREDITGIVDGSGLNNCALVKSKLAASQSSMRSDVSHNIGGEKIDKHGDDDHASSASRSGHVMTFVAPLIPDDHLCSTYSADGSPRATDCRSPVRCRLSLQTSADHTPGAPSLIAVSALAVPLGTSKSARRVREVTPASSRAPARESKTERPPDTFSALAQPELLHQHRLLPPPRLCDGFRCPRAQSPVVRSPLLFSGRRSAPRSTATTSSAVPTVTSDDAHQLTSITPLLRPQLNRTNSESTPLSGTLDDRPTSTMDPISHARPPSASTALRAITPARPASTATTSTSTTNAPTSLATASLHEKYSPANHPTIVTVSVDRLKPMWPLDISEMHNSTPQPVVASQRSRFRPRLGPAATVSAPGHSDPPLVESIPGAFKNTTEASPLATAATCSPNRSPLIEDGHFVRLNTTASAQLSEAPTAPLAGATNAATELHQPLRCPSQPAYSSMRQTGRNAHVISEAKEEVAVSTAALHLGGPPAQRGLLLLRDEALAGSGSAPLVAVGPTAPAAATPVSTSSDGARGAGEPPNALSFNSSISGTRLPGVQHSNRPPESSLQPPGLSLSTNTASGAAVDTQSPISSNATLTGDSTVIHKRRSSYKAGATHSCVSVSSFSGVSVGSSESASTRVMSPSQHRLVKVVKTDTGSLRSPTADIDTASTRSGRNSATGNRSPRPSSAYPRIPSPGGISPAQITTGCPPIVIGEDGTSTLGVPLSMQLPRERPSQGQVQPHASAARASTGVNVKKLPVSIMPRNAHLRVAPTRSSAHEKSLHTVAATISLPEALGCSAAPGNLKANACSSLVSSPRPASTASFDVENSRSSRYSSVSTAASYRPTTSQSNQRRNTRTPRRIIVARPSTASFS